MEALISSVMVLMLDPWTDVSVDGKKNPQKQCFLTMSCLVIFFFIAYLQVSTSCCY